MFLMFVVLQQSDFGFLHGPQLSFRFSLLVNVSR